MDLWRIKLTIVNLGNGFTAGVRRRRVNDGRIHTLTCLLMSMSKVTRGNRILEKMVNQDKLSPTGKDWLLCALDPFHDTQIANIEGWPDTECGASVVRTVKQSVSVARPPSWSASENFDVHVILWPWMKRTNFMEPVQRFANLTALGPQPPSAPVRALGGIQVFAVKAGQSLDLGPDATNTIEIGWLNLDATYTKGSGRLLGLGYEVHNTTAEIYRQGSACCYRMQADVRSPSTHTVCGFLASAPATRLATALSFVQVRGPPANIADAMLIQGSRQWMAEEGMYQVAAFYTNENPARPIDATVPAVFLDSSYDDSEGALNSAAMLIPVPNVAGTGNFGDQLGFVPVRVHPIHQSGSIFSGLSPQSTLTVNFNIFYESFPAISQIDILALAKPSAVYDPFAMELYSRTVQELPVGVPVRENGLGDWFLDAASTAAKYLGPVISTMPHPIAKGAGAALTYLGETGQNYVKRQVPPNAWEQGGSTSAMTAKEADTLIKGAKLQQKRKDKKKIEKAKAKAALRK